MRSTIDTTRQSFKTRNAMHRDEQSIKQPYGPIVAISIAIALNCVLQLDTIATSLDIVIHKTIINIKVECKDALNHLNS
jgi:hypothetical protein